MTNTESSELTREWIRVIDAVRITGISKPKIYQLLAAKKIRSVSLREPGQTRATRLVHLDSLREFIESFEEEAVSV